MSRLIIGHTTDQTTQIWVRGTSENPCAFVELRDAQGALLAEKKKLLEERHFYTGVLDFDGLSPRRVYHCAVTFGRGYTTPAANREQPPDHQGRLRTFPAAGSAAALDFLFGSCNLHSLGPINPPGPAYQRLAAKASAVGADFMLHCGDQIYYDRPVFGRAPSIGDYRKTYLDAWDQNAAARAFLTQLPHYMILDDHEMRNDFPNDMAPADVPVEVLRDFSLKVYREFQHMHTPDTYGTDSLYYTFDFGAVRYFVLDARTERWHYGQSQMIGSRQMDRLLEWLFAYRGDVKFVVTSVPFVTEVRNAVDKWCSPPFRAQRDQILGFLAEEAIPGVVFLTGDMHNSYHARLTLVRGAQESLEVHELMSSPISQLGKTERSRYLDDAVSTLATGWSYGAMFPGGAAGEEFFTGHSNALHVRVAGRPIDYTVFRTKKTEDVLSGSFAV